MPDDAIADDTDAAPSENKLLLRAAIVFARLALATAFLSAVADRFGLWGPPGTPNVFWGSFESFTAYVDVLAPYLPGVLVDIVAWGATIVEIVLAVGLLLGVALRWTAFASAATLLIFGVSMFVFAGFETPFSASVFTAAAAALLVGAAPSAPSPR
ncbi:DoxX family membrane protein [Mycobacterium sp. NPDC051198]